MPKVGMQPIRRRQLIEATLTAINEFGLADATIIRIARIAGVSSGIISHYFGGKDGLLEATMQFILGELGRVVAMRRQGLAEDDVRGHLYAIIEGNFDRGQLDPSVMKTWLAFWASSMHHAPLARLQKVNERRLYSNLCYQFRRCLPLEEARTAASSLAAIIDGLWLRGGLSVEGIDVNECRRLARRQVEFWLDHAAVLEEAS